MTAKKDLPAPAWYLIQTRPRQEIRARENLERQAFHCFLPLFSARRTASVNASRPVDQPFFPGYLFIRLAADDNWNLLRSTRGVSRVVSFCNTPCRVDDTLIEQIRVRCAGHEKPCRFEPGDAVRIQVGPYADMEAIFLARDGQERVVLLLNLLNRQQRLHVDLGHVQPVRTHARAML